MKKETKKTKNQPLTAAQRKSYLITVVVLIVFLSFITLWTRHKNYVPAAPQAETQEVPQPDQVVDLKASQVIQQELIDPNQFQKDINSELGADQVPVIPQIPDSALNLESNNQKNVADYLNAINKMSSQYTTDTEDTTQNMFDSSVPLSQLDSAYARTQKFVSDLYKMPVPADASLAQKAIINTYDAYAALIKLAKQYNVSLNPDQANKEIFAQMSIIQTSISRTQTEFSSLEQRYKIQIQQ